MSQLEDPKSRVVFFFDIDNCLYPRSSRVQDLMQELIDGYFIRHLELSPEDAVMLHRQYYKDYGLAITGLVKYHKIDPLAYNREVDDALPLDDIIKPDVRLRKLLLDMDKTMVKLWLFTNAHITHGRRVVKLLGVDDIFEGITYCNYEKIPLIAKPHTEMFDKAEAEAGATSSEECYFVDDSLLNCKQASSRGWKVIHKLERGDVAPITADGLQPIYDLEEIRDIFPRLFKAQKEPSSQL